VGQGARAKTGIVKVRKVQRQRTAFDLKLEGWSIRQIAEKLRISVARVYQLINEELEEGVPEDVVTRVRELRIAELESQKKRQNEVIASWLRGAKTGDVEAAKRVDAAENTLIRIGARQDAITGVDAPAKAVVASGDITGVTPAEARQVMRELFAGDVGPSAPKTPDDDGTPGEGTPVN